MKSSELINSDPRSVNIMKKDINLDILSKYCGQALENARKGLRLYKGMGNYTSEFIKTDPKLFIRTSANSKNYYTLLLDNLPSWSAYPKRSRSLICSNNAYTADHFKTYKTGGTSSNAVYLVLTFDNANFGICPSRDIWNSEFPGSESGINLDFHDLNCTFKNYLISDTNYTDMINSIFENRESFGRPGLQTTYKEFSDAIVNAKSTNDIEDILDYFYYPGRLGFKNTNQVPKLDGPKAIDREIWTDSEAYLINTESMLYQNI